MGGVKHWDVRPLIQNVDNTLYKSIHISLVICLDQWAIPNSKTKNSLLKYNWYHKQTGNGEKNTVKSLEETEKGK